MHACTLTPVQQTALATAYARALDSRSPRPILGDAVAGEIVDAVDFDFAGLGVTPSVVCLVALRAKMLDDRIRRFVAEHPDAVVVDLGAGLDSAAFRVDPPPGVDWYNVDLPEMIALRDAVVPQRDRTHSVAASVAEPEWFRPIPARRPAMAFADGLFPFLSDAQVVELVRRITAHFASGTIAFNDYGTVSRFNRFARLLMARKPMFRTMYSQWAFRGFSDAKEPEGWSPGIRLVEEVSAMREADIESFPPLLRLAARIPAVANKARVLRYQFPAPEPDTR